MATNIAAVSKEANNSQKNGAVSLDKLSYSASANGGAPMSQFSDSCTTRPPLGPLSKMKHF